LVEIRLGCGRIAIRVWYRLTRVAEWIVWSYSQGKKESGKWNLW
jgi:hypothetical protein